MGLGHHTHKKDADRRHAAAHDDAQRDEPVVEPLSSAAAPAVPSLLTDRIHGTPLHEDQAPIRCLVRVYLGDWPPSLSITPFLTNFSYLI